MLEQGDSIHCGSGPQVNFDDVAQLNQRVPWIEFEIVQGDEISGLFEPLASRQYGFVNLHALQYFHDRLM